MRNLIALCIVVVSGMSCADSNAGPHMPSPGPIMRPHPPIIIHVPTPGPMIRH